MIQKPKNPNATSGTTSNPKSEMGRVLKRKPRAKKAAAKAKTTGNAKTPPTKKAATAKGTKEPKSERPEKEIVAGSLADLRDKFCAHLLTRGKSAGTARSYAADLNVACKHFSADKPVAKITKAEAQGFIDSDVVNLDRKGSRKNQITIDKVVRVFRQAIDFAVAESWMKSSPLPEFERRSRKPVVEASAPTTEVSA